MTSSDLPDRRAVLAAGLGTVLAAAPGGARAQPQDGPGLGAIARERRLTFGAAAQAGRLGRDALSARVFAAECAVLVPEYEGKWAALQPAEGRFDPAPLQALVDWGRERDIPVRGHALVWHNALPDWVPAALAEGPQRARAVMEAHINAVLDRFRDTIRDWDVVNEAVANPPGSDIPQASGELRDTPWLRALGPSYIGLALRLARERDATLRLTLNDYGVEEAIPACDEKRRRLLALVRGLRRDNVPLDAVGIQAHLQMDRPFNGAVLTAFLRDLRAEGVEVLVTELDVREGARVPEGYAARDRLVAERVRAFADAALAGGVRTIMTWGLIDRDSWLASDPGVARRDNLHHRGLPLDWEGNRKPYWQALADAFRAAA